MARLFAAVFLALAIALSGCSDDSSSTTSESGDEAGGNTGGSGGPGGQTGGSAEGGEVNSTTQRISTVTIRATGAYPVNPALDPDGVEVDAGAVLEVTFENADQNPLITHNWLLEVTGDVTETIDPGETTTLLVNVPTVPGEYVFYCDIGDHRQRGMEGVLIVV